MHEEKLSFRLRFEVDRTYDKDLFDLLQTLPRSVYSRVILDLAREAIQHRTLAPTGLAAIPVAPRHVSPLMGPVPGSPGVQPVLSTDATPAPAGKIGESIPVLDMDDDTLNAMLGFGQQMRER